MKRIDALANHPKERLGSMTGRVLDPSLDDELQGLVAEASSALGMPIALVTLVLEHTQMFRAHTGLPEVLAVSRATDRDASFCQFVVRDGKPFEVADAAVDKRVPTELVERFGIRSYLGYPVSVGKNVVGSLCTIDVRPREFSEGQRRLMERLARRASVRLGDLARIRAGTSRELVSRAVAPAFGEIRNVTGLLTTAAALARVSIAELNPLVEIVRDLAARRGDEFPELRSLTQAYAAFDDLREMFGQWETGTQRLLTSVEALESLLARSLNDVTELAEVVEIADRVAHHQTKLHGGVTWRAVPGVSIAAPRMVAASVVSAALGLVCDLSVGPAGIVCRFEVGERVRVHIESSLDDAGREEVVKCLGELVGEGVWVDVGWTGDSVWISFAVANPDLSRSAGGGSA